MNLKDGKQQNIQKQLDFSDALTGEAEKPVGKRLNRPGRQVNPNTQLEPID